MASSPKNYEIGRGKPPKHTRWSPGQTGNPSRIRKRRSLDVAKLIDRAFARRIKVTESGATRMVTVFEAILLQLWTRAAKGSTRAMRSCLRYQDFVAARGGFRRFELRFAEADDDAQENAKS